MKGPIKLKIKPKDRRNLFHFDVQRSIKCNVFRDRTKYTRKKKHKNKDEEYY